MRRARMFLVAFGAAFAASAQLFNFNTLNRFSPVQVTGRAHLEPTDVIAGEPCAIVMELELGKNEGVEDLNVGGLPDAEDGKIVYGETVENMADGKTDKKDRVLKRFRLPARFLAPMRQDVVLTMQGMAVTRSQKGGMSFTSSQSFLTRTAPFTINVQPLPEEGRPADFSGAIGHRFALSQTLSPDRMRPGDLVTATYTLTFDGYCPSNLCPRLSGLSDAFKTYEPKEVAREDGKIVWTQMLVPRTSAATNSASLSVGYYDVRAKRYRECTAAPRSLVFVSDKAASTENTAVVVNTGDTARNVHADGASAAIALRFAPADNSPTVAILPPGTPVRELARTKTGWRRLESPVAIGWTR